jgi:hypothetical protein
LPKFVKFDRLTKQFSFSPTTKDYLKQEKYSIEVSLVDSWGASTTHTFSLRLRTSPALSQKEIDCYLVETAIYKVSRDQEASLRIKSRSREQLV